jgi:hypothetical protein
MLKKKIWASFQRIIEVKKIIVTQLSKIWVWDPGSEIRDPEKIYSGSRIRIRNTGFLFSFLTLVGCCWCTGGTATRGPPASHSSSFIVVLSSPPCRSQKFPSQITKISFCRRLMCRCFDRLFEWLFPRVIAFDPGLVSLGTSSLGWR